MDKYLNELYSNPKSIVAFSSAAKLWRKARERYPKLTLSRVKQYLKSVPSYTLHQPARRKFKRGRVITGGLNEQADVDLADVSNRASQNNGIKFLLIYIDPFSRQASVETLRNKEGPTVANAFSKLFERIKPPKSIRHDDGKEFVNTHVKQLMKERNVQQFVTRTAPKANYAERFIRTLKGRLHKYMTHNNTKKYIDILQDVVNAYNNSYHSSIKMKPNAVNEQNESELWQRLYMDTPVETTDRKVPKLIKHKYKEAQQVRISLRKHPFEKGYTPNWSETVYVIRDRLYRENIPVYKISDLYGRPYRGTYYEPEIQPVSVSLDKEIEKVIQTRRKNGKTEYHIRWRNYGPAYDQWVSKQILEKYQTAPDIN